MKIRRIFVVAAAGLLAAGCSGKGNSKKSVVGEPDVETANQPLPVQANVVHRNAQLGVPSFSWLSPLPGQTLARTGATAKQVAWGTLRGLAETYQLGDHALDSTSLSRLHDPGKGPIVAQFEQHVDGLDVWSGRLSIAMTRGNEPVAASGSLVPSIQPLPQRAFSLDARAAVVQAIHAMLGRTIGAGDVIQSGAERASYQSHSVLLGRQVAQARTKRLWYPQHKGLEPAWYVELDVPRDNSVESMGKSFIVSAHDGAVLFQKDLIAYEAYTYRVWGDNGGPFGPAPQDSPFGTVTTPHPTGLPDGTQFPFIPSSLFTFESLATSRRDPWLPASAAELSGNNTRAYADITSPDGYNSGDVLVPPSGPHAFDYAYDPLTAPQATVSTRRAITTNLFFIINYMHDLFYDAGWDEASFNPQVDNYGRGGTGGDPILSEAQDSSGRNNANAMTPADGSSPRIQMYLFNGTSARSFAVNSPMPMAGEKPAVTGRFGPLSFELTGDLVLVDDGSTVNPTPGSPQDSGTVTDGCQPLINGPAVMGKIALIDSGNCDFSLKAKNAQDAGASGVLFDNVSNGPFADGYGWTNTSITLPNMMIRSVDGMAIKTALATGPVNVTLVRNAPIDRDGSLDGTVVSHEWGHVLSNRLIGNANGLNNSQGGAMGEGWSDFVGIISYLRPSDADLPANANWTGAWAIGGYAIVDPNTHYYGIRRYPYSADLARNPLTFKHIMDGVPLPTSPPPAFGADGRGNSEVHNAGEVWANVMWECQVALLRATPRLSFTEATTRMRNYLVASLKMTPNDPTYLEARDALLAVTAAADPADFAAISQAFARRGMGVGAVAPDRSSYNHAGVVESFLAGNDLQLVSIALEQDTPDCDEDGFLDNGETARLRITVRNTGWGNLNATTATVTSNNPAVTVANGGVVSFPASTMQQLVTATIAVSMAGATGVTPFTLTVAVTDPTIINIDTPRTGTFAQTGNVDFVPNRSSTDDVNAPMTVWTPAADPSANNSPWRRVDDGNGGLKWLWPPDSWGGSADMYLISPPLVVANTGELSFTYKTRWSFEDLGTRQPDGGVIEISTDDGATWTDIGTRATANGYNGSIVASSNPLHGRRAFTVTNTGYPAYVNTTVDLGTTYRGRTIKIRFRGGADFALAEPGWDIDDIAFTGLAVPPFHARVAHRGLCGRIPDMAMPPPPIDMAKVPDMATVPDLASDACTPSISSYQLGRCNATAVYKNKLYKCISQAPNVNGEVSGCGTPGVYCSTIPPDYATWGSTAWQLLRSCNP